MSDILGSLGYNVLTADEFNVADRLKTFRPDYVIVNYIMREMRGDQLISLIKVQYPGIYCILSSNNSIPLEEFRYKKIDAIIRTPIDKMMLGKVLHELVCKTDIHGNERAAAKHSIGPQTPSTNDNRELVSSVKDISKEEAAFCPYCGKNLQDAAGVKCTFCPYCGGRLQQTGT
jgi:CheY-like chemotaxis protein